MSSGPTEYAQLKLALLLKGRKGEWALGAAHRLWAMLPELHALNSKSLASSLPISQPVGALYLIYWMRALLLSFFFSKIQGWLLALCSR